MPQKLTYLIHCFVYFQGGSIKLSTLKNFLRAQSSDSSKGSESSKKQDFCPDRAASPEPVDGKASPTHIFPRFGGSSQPSSPSTSRRKFMKRHHSSTNISMTENLDDYDRSKSEGEEDEHTFHPRPSHSTKAYSYARPPPPSYRESRNKGRTPVGNNAQVPSNKDLASETADFNSLTDETKRRLLSFTLRNKVNEKKKQKVATNTPTTTQNGVVEHVRKESVTVTMTIPRKPSNSSQAGSSGSDEQVVATEPQLSPSEVRQRFEQRSVTTSDNKITSEPSTVKTFSREAVRLRDGSTSSSSSRNFKIYSKGDVTFSHCPPHQINEWMKDLAMSPPKGPNERGRTRAKTEDLSKTLRRCSSVARTSFTQDDEEIIMKRRSLSCQDINIGDEDVLTRERSLSKSSDSSQSSDEEDNPIEASSEAFDEKLRGLMQKCKLDSKSKTELQQVRKSSQVSRPSSYRVNRTPVEKMRDLDPSSNIQSGAVSSMKSLFESGAAHQQIVKSRSSSLSSASSGSILSNDTHRKSTSSTLSDADVKRRVWESGEAKPGESKKQWKEPEWVARERAMKNLCSGSESSMKEQPDDNNNLPKGRESKLQYSRSTSLPIRDSGYVVKDVTVEQKSPVVNSQVVRKFCTDNLKSSVESPTIQRAAVKNGPVIRKVTPVSAVHYKPESETQSEKRPPMSHLNYKSDSRTQFENVSGPVSAVQHEHKAKSQAGSLSSVQYKEQSKTELNCSRDQPNKATVRMIVGRTQSSPLRSRHSSQESSHPTSPRFVNSFTSDDSISPTSPPSSSFPKQKSTGPRRRIVSDTTRQTHSETRQTGRTFTAPILGTIVTTTNAIELSGFAIKPESINRNPKARVVRRSERQDKVGQGGQRKISSDMHISPANFPTTTLTIPKTSSPPNYGSPSIRRKGVGLSVPELDDAKRLSTDRCLLEQNALHIKELLDEMNTEHSLKMERQKSDTISIDAQKAARNRARVRRHSLGQGRENRENGVVVASRVSPSEVLNERHRREAQASRSKDIPRNVSTVEWVGVSG